MRTIASILLLLTIIVGAYIGYCYIGITMQIDTVTSAWMPVTESMETYEHIQRQLAEGAFSGTIYTDEPFPDMEDMSFLTFTVHMGNQGLLAQDWIEIHVTPKEGDIALLPAERTPTLAAGTRSTFSATILTRSSVDGNRDIRVTYYVLGRRYEVSYSMQGYAE